MSFTTPEYRVNSIKRWQIYAVEPLDEETSHQACAKSKSDGEKQREQEDDSLSCLTSFWYDWCPHIPDILSYISNVMLKTSSQGSHRFPQTENKDPTRTSLALKGPALHVYASFFSPTHAPWYLQVDLYYYTALFLCSQCKILDYSYLLGIIKEC